MEDLDLRMIPSYLILNRIPVCSARNRLGVKGRSRKSQDSEQYSRTEKDDLDWGAAMQVARFKV